MELYFSPFHFAFFFFFHIFCLSVKTIDFLELRKEVGFQEISHPRIVLLHGMPFLHHIPYFHQEETVFLGIKPVCQILALAVSIKTSDFLELRKEVGFLEISHPRIVLLHGMPFLHHIPYFHQEETVQVWSKPSHF